MTKAYVVDSSTCLKWVFEDEIDSDPALALLKDHLTGKIELLAPNIWVYEIANGLRTAYLRERLLKKEGSTKLKQLLKSSPFLVNIEEKIDICLKNAFDYQISVYDSAYVTLAITSKIILLSSDSKLVKKINSPNIALNLRDYRSS